jgi:hypothetical protein
MSSRESRRRFLPALAQRPGYAHHPAWDPLHRASGRPFLARDLLPLAVLFAACHRSGPGWDRAGARIGPAVCTT